MRLRDLKIGTRIRLMAAVAVFILAVMALIGYYRVIRLQEAFQELRQESHEMSMVMDLGIAISQAVVPVNDYLAAGGDPDGKANFEKIAKKLEEKLSSVGAHAVNSPDEKEIFLSAQKGYLGLKQKAMRIFAIPQERAYGSPEAGRLMEELGSLADDAVSETAKWHEVSTKEIAESEENFSRAQRELILFSSSLILLFICFAVVVSGMLNRSITRPITSLLKTARDITLGDLSVRAEEAAKDEIGDLASSINKMTADLQKALIEVTQARDYADSIVSSMIDTLIVVTPGGNIRDVNKATCDLLGYTEKELMGRPVGMIFAEEEEEEEEEELFKGTRLRKLFEEGPVRAFEMTYKTRSGERVPVSFSGSVIYENERLADSVERTGENKLYANRFTLNAEKTAKHSPLSAKVIGVVGVARDMRETKGLIASLERSKAELQEWASTLEEKVGERTRALEESHEAALNMMEDIQEERNKVVKKAAELDSAYNKLRSFSIDLEKKTTELSTLYDVSNAISYTLDYQSLLKLIMATLRKMVDFDICASILFDDTTASITLNPVYQGGARFSNEIKEKLIKGTSILSGKDVRKKKISVFFIPAGTDAEPEKTRQFDEIRSFFNVPFIAHRETVGMINVSSCRENAFSENDVRLIYTMANQAANAIERLKAVIVSEKSKMESMVANMTEGVIMIDERGKVVICNPRAKEILGLGSNDEITSGMLFEKLEAAGLCEIFLECQNKKTALTRDIELPALGKNLFVRCDMTFVKDEKGGIVGFVAILRDVTADKEIDAMKTEFISIVSHELRTPLSITKEGLSLVLDGIAGEISEKQEKFLGTAKNNIGRLENIINDLLDISKIESGKTVMNMGVADIAELALQVTGDFKIRMEERGLELRMNTPEEGAVAYVDKEKIVQVFVNLIGNALKFTEKGFMEVSVYDKKDVIECSVRDSGKGISRENLPDVFGKFQQFDRPQGGSGEKGTGLGLSIAKGIIELHHGEIWVESELNKGTVFTFTLPKYSDEMIFKKCVSDGIKKAQAEGAKMSLLMVFINGFDELKRKLSKDKIDKILHGAEADLKKSLRREGNVVAMGTGEMIVVLTGCDREKALCVEGRLEQSLESYSKTKNEPEDIAFRFGVATYPDDAKDGEGLIKKAKQSRDVR